MIRTKSWLLIAMSALMLLGASCEKEKKEESKFPVLDELAGNYLLETTVKNPDGKSGSSYIQMVPNISGELDLSTSIQLDMAAPVTVIGDDVYTMPGFYATTHNMTKYHRDGQQLNKVGELPLVANSTGLLVPVSADKAYITFYQIGIIWIIDLKMMSKTGEMSLAEYAHGDTNPEPSMGMVRDGIYYLPLNQGGANYMPYDDYRQSDVLVIDVATDKVLKMISEKKTGLCFPTRPLFNGLMFMNEAKDIWIACAGYFAYNPDYLKNGFLCIPNGSQNFDEAKSWDISTTTIEGTPYKAAALYNVEYIGNGKVAALVGIAELSGDPLTARNSAACVIDLNNKTIKRLSDIPMSNGHSGALLRWKNKMFFTAGGEHAAGIWQYDPTTEEVKQVLNTTADIGKIHAFN